MTLANDDRLHPSVLGYGSLMKLRWNVVRLVSENPELKVSESIVSVMS